eukprot:4872277-Pyramimonas_sp.AAC.1
MLTYYETIHLGTLAARCVQVEIPEVLTRLTLFAYRCGRFVSIAGLLDCPYFVGSGVIAGCSMATTHIRVYAMSSFETIPIYPSRESDVYFDATTNSCAVTSKH